PSPPPRRIRRGTRPAPRRPYIPGRTASPGRSHPVRRLPAPHRTYRETRRRTSWGEAAAGTSRHSSHGRRRTRSWLLGRLPCMCSRSRFQPAPSHGTPRGTRADSRAQSAHTPSPRGRNPSGTVLRPQRAGAASWDRTEAWRTRVPGSSRWPPPARGPKRSALLPEVEGKSLSATTFAKTGRSGSVVHGHNLAGDRCHVLAASERVRETDARRLRDAYRGGG